MKPSGCQMQSEMCERARYAVSEMCERQQGVCKKLIPMATRRNKDDELVARWPRIMPPKPI